MPQGTGTIVDASSVRAVCKAPLHGLSAEGLAASFPLPERASHVNHRPTEASGNPNECLCRTGELTKHIHTS